MGILDFVKQGTKELMIARPDNAKHLIVYKHPDQTIPFWSQLTVDSDEGAVFFKDGQVMGLLGPGRHTLQTQNIPFLSNLVDKFTGGNVFISEIFFVRSQPIRELKFGGRVGSMIDPVTDLPCDPRIFGEYALQILDPIRFIVAYAGQAASARDNDQIGKWIADQFMKGVSEVLAAICMDEQTSIVAIASRKQTLSQRFMQGCPTLDHIGVRITELGNFNITLDEKDKEEIMAVWKDIRTGLKQAEAAAKKKQFELDQKFSQDVRYSNLAGQHPGYMQYAQAHAIMGAGDGMAQGGGNVGVAALGAQMAVGVGMANMMQPMAAPQRVAAVPASAPVACGKCGMANASGKFCANCGAPLAAPMKSFCTGCGQEVSGKFCANCGTPAGGPAGAPGGGPGAPGAPPQAPGAGMAPQGGPPAGAGYAAPPPGYPQAPQGYPQAPQGYPQAPQGYPQAPQGYPQAPQQPAPQGYPQAPQGYPQPPQGGGYPPQGGQGGGRPGG
ncbi:MAG: SPFH domain-containing protein [Polyangiaceae bacterium]|nr:SPFH domain-containing protein [Polyangiaceae bacterium]